MNPINRAETIIDLSKRSRKDEAERFQRLMADPAIKFIMSQIPPGPEDALRVLLAKVHDESYQAGAQFAVASLVQLVAEAKGARHGD